MKSIFKIENNMYEKTLISFISEQLLGKEIKVFKLYPIRLILSGGFNLFFYDPTPIVNPKSIIKVEESTAVILQATAKDFGDEGVSVELKVELAFGDFHELTLELTDTLIFMK